MAHAHRSFFHHSPRTVALDSDTFVPRVLVDCFAAPRSWVVRQRFSVRPRRAGNFVSMLRVLGARYNGFKGEKLIRKNPLQ